jgi:glutamate:Na+ symporter, ESS family
MSAIELPLLPLFAVLSLLARRLSGLAVTFDTSAKTPFLLLFFASISLTTDLVLLRQGGVRLLRFLIALFPFLLVQNAGPDNSPTPRVAPGARPGRAINHLGGRSRDWCRYAERFAEEHDILGVMGLAMTSATIGLVEIGHSDAAAR